MYEYKTETMLTSVKWVSDKATREDLDAFDAMLNSEAANGWEFVSMTYTATTLQVRGAFIATFRRPKQ